MNDAGGRHELKHYINRSDLIQLRSRLPCVMKRDEFVDENGGYRIRSLYFDNYNDKALFEKLDGNDEREKFRIRFYNDDPSFIRLEKKSKKRNLCYKQSAALSFEECRDIIEGRYEFLKQSGDSLHLEFYAKMRHDLLRPKNIVDYRRDAFIYPAGNVRITVDYDIRTSFTPADFLKPQYASIPIPEVFILEVKYDSFLPEVVRGVTTLSCRSETAFSKYAATRLI